MGFESRANDEHGMHSAVMLECETRGAFPPNTLFRLKKIFEPGTWQAPGGAFPQQRLLLVTATFRTPLLARQESDSVDSKMGANTIVLQYGARNKYAAGLPKEIFMPIMTLQQEFDRFHRWVDWKNASHSLRECWQYVTGPACRAENQAAGIRDDNNDGLQPEDFLNRVNAHIHKRRAQGIDGRLPEDCAYLDLNECLAVRLYSGPAYQPINEFLRQISSLHGDYLREIVWSPGLTFSATVAHICQAIRKLAAVRTEDEMCAPLYRGLRGELQASFWLPDQYGHVCAVDCAFMSTTLRQQTAIDYMSSDTDNVLWVLLGGPQSDAAYHNGAPIALLSQFAAEEEVLFPPMTMLEVKRSERELCNDVQDAESEHEAATYDSARERRASQTGGKTLQRMPSSLRARMRMYAANWDEVHMKAFLRIEATPYFV